MSPSTMPKTACQVKAWIANTTLFGAIALVVVLLCIPVVVFLVFRGSDSASWQDSLSPLSLLLDTCDSQSAENTSNTSTSLGCTALPQTSPCYPHIQALLEGKVTSNNMSLIVSPLGNVSGLQANLKLLLRDPLSLLTPKCRSAGLPLYCNFLFPPCSNGSVDPTLQLTRSQCTTLVEDVCQKEFSLLMSFFDHIRDRVANVVPKCDALQEDNEPGLGQVTGITSAGPALNSSVESGRNRSSATENSAVLCHPDFVHLCGLCIPSCGHLYLNSPLATSYAVDDGFWITSCVMATVGAIAFIVLSLIRRKDVFQFPTILVFYESLAELLLGVVFLLGQAIGREKTFCSHPDVVRTLTNPPTPFCSLSGVVFQFTSGVLLGCWVAQLTYMVILLYFPFFGERTLKKKKKLYHAVSLVAIITLSLISPVVALAKFNYITSRFPPLLCLPSNQDWVFYAMVLPICILVAVGAIFCILLVRAIHKGLRTEANELKDRLSSKKKQFFSAPEVKLLILSILLVVLGVVVLGRFSYILATQAQYARQLLEYSTCQLRGNRPDCVLDPVISNINIMTNILAAIAVAAVPFMNMIFPARYSDFVKMANLLCSICRRKWSCASICVEGNPPVQNDAMGKSPQVTPTDYKLFH